MARDIPDLTDWFPLRFNNPRKCGMGRTKPQLHRAPTCTLHSIETYGQRVTRCRVITSRKFGYSRLCTENLCKGLVSVYNSTKNHCFLSSRDLGDISSLYV